MAKITITSSSGMKFVYDSEIMDEFLDHQQIKPLVAQMKPETKELFILSLIREGMYHAYLQERKPKEK